MDRKPPITQIWCHLFRALPEFMPEPHYTLPPPHPHLAILETIFFPDQGMARHPGTNFIPTQGKLPCLNNGSLLRQGRFPPLICDCVRVQGRLSALFNQHSPPDQTTTWHRDACRRFRPKQSWCGPGISEDLKKATAGGIALRGIHGVSRAIPEDTWLTNYDSFRISCRHACSHIQNAHRG